MEMTIEKLQMKLENQSKLIKELTNENEELYHQYNHLMIRNGKMLKRVDDLQKIIDDLHVRIEELQLINGNMMQINDRLRTRSDSRFATNNNQAISAERMNSLNNPVADFDMEAITERWKTFPGQKAQNGPNLKKQMLMLVHLYTTASLRASELFNLAGVGGVTGARYVSTLKKFGLIRYTGARKKGHYEITKDGVEFVENTGHTPLAATAESKFESPAKATERFEAPLPKTSFNHDSVLSNHDDL
jgi:predicted transcriptional regulator/uncharacterized protein YoxC